MNVLKQAAAELRWPIERVAATAAIPVEEAQLILDRASIDPADLKAGTLGLLKRAFELRGVLFVNDDTEIEGPCHVNQLRRLVLRPEEISDLELLARQPLHGMIVPTRNHNAFMRGLQHMGLTEIGAVTKTVTFEGHAVTWAEAQERRIRLSAKGRALCAMWNIRVPA